ncbi:hypothetical protein ABCS02_15555 [Microbacterium sp. X-17]|uniref:hypothetical protein n=1 Tax=Microbacterium sp. X-17 TaxID=3144404 RepID=UPI0031F4E476
MEIAGPDRIGEPVIPGAVSGRADGAAQGGPVRREGSAILPGADFPATGSSAGRSRAIPAAM